jgi:hypothetical protein
LVVSAKFTDLTLDQWRSQIGPLLLDPEKRREFFTHPIATLE